MKGLASVLAVFACGAVLRVPAFTRPLLSDDEAIYAATADALGRGALLYRDAVDHKPPAIYHLYQAGFALAGEWNTHGAHLLVLLAVLVTALLLARLAGSGGRSAATATGTGVIAAGLYLVFSTTWHDYDALAANCELFLLAPQAGAALLALRAFEHPPRGLRFCLVSLATGALVGASALCKYQGVTFLGVSAGLLAWAVFLRRETVLRALAALALVILGTALLPAAYLAWCRHLGNADATLDWFAFNFSYVGAGLAGGEALARGAWRLALIGGVALVPYALGGAAAVTTAAALGRVLRRGRAVPSAVALPEAPDVLGLLWLVTSAVAVAAGGRFFGHYFHLLLAPLCLLAAPRFAASWRRGRAVRAGLAALVVVPALAFFLLATLARPLAERWDHREPPYEAVAARIAALTRPGDGIFVWGNSPQLYVLARRPMGTRFSFCNYMTGESPGTPTETGARDAAANALAVSWDMLIDDLTRRRPALVVDASAAGWDGYDKYPLTRYPRLAAFVARHYRLVESPAGVALWLRAP